jgi:hypothetical protein
MEVGFVSTLLPRSGNAKTTTLTGRSGMKSRNSSMSESTTPCASNCAMKRHSPKWLPITNMNLPHAAIGRSVRYGFGGRIQGSAIARNRYPSPDILEVIDAEASRTVYWRERDCMCCAKSPFSSPFLRQSMTSSRTQGNASGEMHRSRSWTSPSSHD